MIKLLFFSSLLLPFHGHAQSGESCPNALLKPPVDSKLMQGLDDCAKGAKDPAACEDYESQNKSRADFAKLVSEDKAKGVKIIMARQNPDSRTSNSVTYKFPAQKLAPGESMYLWIPSDMTKSSVNFAILGHRQNPATNKGSIPGDKWDHEPGITSVQVYDPTKPPKERWRYWEGDASGKFGGKFAEIGSSYEMEGLYQWNKYGHSGVESGDHSTGELHPSVVRLQSVGTDTVEIGELTLKTNPPEPTSYQEGLFTSGTSFGAMKSGTGYSMGGGQANKGVFPNAVQLGGGSGKTPAALPTGWKYMNGELHIPLPAGKRLASVELAVGDAHPDGITNEDGGWGTKGWSKLSVQVRKDGQVVDRMMERENVPPEGFLNAAPAKCARISQDGEELVVRADSDISYLAGIRLGFRDF